MATVAKALLDTLYIAPQRLPLCQPASGGHSGSTQTGLRRLLDQQVQAAPTRQAIKARLKGLMN